MAIGKYEPVKRLQQDNSWMHKAEGKAVKVVVGTASSIFPHNTTYKIIFMQRPMQEVLASQTVMLERRGAQEARPMIRRSGPSLRSISNRTERWLALTATHDGSCQ